MYLLCEYHTGIQSLLVNELFDRVASCNRIRIASSTLTALFCKSLFGWVCPDRLCGLWVHLRDIRRTKLCDEKLIGVGNLPGHFVVASYPLQAPTLLVDSRQPSS
jgi:hypothetical protein